MKRIINLALIFTVLTVIYTVQVKAQEPVRIQFAKGKSSATVKGSTGKYGTTYVIRAKSGQKLVLMLSPTKNVGIDVRTQTRDGEVVLLQYEAGGTYRIGLDETGDVTIFIGATTRQPQNFTLTVKVAKLADI